MHNFAAPHNCLLDQSMAINGSSIIELASSVLTKESNTTTHLTSKKTTTKNLSADLHLTAHWQGQVVQTAGQTDIVNALVELGAEGEAVKTAG